MMSFLSTLDLVSLGVLNVISLVLACVLDLFLRDPKSWPHPVEGIGWVIGRLERFLFGLGWNGFWGGVLCVLGTLIITMFVVVGSLFLAFWLHEFLYLLLATLWMYWGVAMGELAHTAKRVYLALIAGDKEKARLVLGEIVGRDTHDLEEEDICRGVIESVAENGVDGVWSPLFYGMIGGPVALWVFKVASTCDSMIGYKNERYRFFGTFGARMDDVMNYIPARLTYVLIPIGLFSSFYIMGKGLKGRIYHSLREAWQEGQKHKSPNSGISEAAFAGALKVCLGGNNTYQGVLRDHPLFGSRFELPKTPDITKAVLLLRSTSAAMVVLYLLIFFWIY